MEYKELKDIWDKPDINRTLFISSSKKLRDLIMNDKNHSKLLCLNTTMKR